MRKSKPSRQHTQELVDQFIEDNRDELGLPPERLKHDFHGVFYCEWLPIKTKKERKLKKKIQEDHPNCCFNHGVGLPTLKFDDEEQESEPIPLMGFNRRMFTNYFLHRKYSQNKCRGSGTSELLTIRYMIFKYAILNKIPNHICMIVPGTSKELSDEFSIRIKAICDKIPWVYAKIPTSDKPKEFLFKTTGRIRLTGASVSAPRGLENIGDIILEEVAHWNLEDDLPVYRSTQFLHQKTNCHVLHSTTPKGKRGFYYSKVWDPDVKTSFYKHQINWREVTGLPVRMIDELFDRKITEQSIKEIRAECVQRYEKDKKYRDWFDDFFGGLSMQEVIDVPKIIMNVNATIQDAIESRNDWDQEMDNKFIATDRKAIGDFETDEFEHLNPTEALLASHNDEDYEPL